MLIGVGSNISVSKSADCRIGEINSSVNDDLTSCWELGEPCDDPAVGILNCTTDLTLNID